jgi:hypothetical protein
MQLSCIIHTLSESFVGAAVTKLVNLTDPLIPGRCSITLSFGEMMETNFEMECNEWTGTSPLVYSIGIIQSITSDPATMKPFKTSYNQVFSFIVPNSKIVLCGSVESNGIVIGYVIFPNITVKSENVVQSSVFNWISQAQNFIQTDPVGALTFLQASVNSMPTLGFSSSNNSQLLEEISDILVSIYQQSFNWDKTFIAQFMDVISIVVSSENLSAITLNNVLFLIDDLSRSCFLF